MGLLPDIKRKIIFTFNPPYLAYIQSEVDAPVQITADYDSL